MFGNEVFVMRSGISGIGAAIRVVWELNIVATSMLNILISEFIFGCRMWTCLALHAANICEL